MFLFSAEKDTIPGQVTYEAQKEADSEYKIMWNEPEDPNGYILSYTIVVSDAVTKVVKPAYLFTRLR